VTPRVTGRPFQGDRGCPGNEGDSAGCRGEWRPLGHIPRRGSHLPVAASWNIRVAVRPSQDGNAVPGTPKTVCRKGVAGPLGCIPTSGHVARRFVGPESPSRGRPRLGGSTGRGLGLGRWIEGRGGAVRTFSGAGSGHLVGATSGVHRESGASGPPGRIPGRGPRARQVCGEVRGAARTYSLQQVAQEPPGHIPGSGSSGPLTSRRAGVREGKLAKKPTYSNMDMYEER